MTVMIIEQISAREAGEISHMCFLNLLPMQAFAFIGFWYLVLNPEAFALESSTLTIGHHKHPYSLVSKTYVKWWRKFHVLWYNITVNIYFSHVRTEPSLPGYKPVQWEAQKSCALCSRILMAKAGVEPSKSATLPLGYHTLVTPYSLARV